MSLARPAAAPPPQPQMNFFQRNAAMMRDPQTGAFIDPANAAIAQAQMGNGSDLISKMMGYLHKKSDNFTPPTRDPSTFGGG
jgi:hypothetical protein